MENFKTYIEEDYHYSLYLDELPSATVVKDGFGKDVYDYFDGIPIGHVNDGNPFDKGKIIFYNHLEITVEVHETLDGHHRVVAFDVEPMSLADDDHRMNLEKMRE